MLKKYFGMFLAEYLAIGPELIFIISISRAPRWQAKLRLSG
jgi:hypothetical protein